MFEKIKNVLRGPIVSSLFYIVLGLVLTLLPVKSINITCKVIFGIVMVLAGIYHIMIHLLESSNSTILDLFSGVILTVFGVFLFMNPLIVVKLLPVLLGAFVLVDSVWMLKGAFRLKKLKRGSWKILVFVSLIFIGLGVTLIVNPFKVVTYTVIFAGATLIGNGLTDLIFWIMIRLAVKKAGKQEKALTEGNMDMNSQESSVSPQTDIPVYEEWNSHIEAEHAADENCSDGGITGDAQEMSAEESMALPETVNTFVKENRNQEIPANHDILMNPDGKNNNV